MPRPTARAKNMKAQNGQDRLQIIFFPQRAGWKIQNIKYKIQNRSSKYKSYTQPWKIIPFHSSSNSNFSMEEVGRQAAWQGRQPTTHNQYLSPAATSHSNHTKARWNNAWHFADPTQAKTITELI